MAKFEMRLIERKVKVFQVEADSEEQAREAYEASDEADILTDSWPIEPEDGVDWHKVS